MNILETFPHESELLKWSETNLKDTVYEVNGHIHTPYSFSAFADLKQAFDLAKKGNIKILGINDFYVTDGYDEFYENAIKNKIFPLFNIEFTSLASDLQQKGILVNDPNNPGRIYFSGKGLDYPVGLKGSAKEMVESTKIESLRHVEAMIKKTNDLLLEIDSSFFIDFKEIKKKFAKELVRERHIAKALHTTIFGQYATNEERKSFLTKLYNGKEPKADLENNSAVENEIRNNLLKAGGKAFVGENEQAFLKVEDVIEIIISAGGIPCYPVLLDDPKGKVTDFEADKETLYSEFTKKNIFCIELIPCRNSYTIMRDFVLYFHHKGFIILFGTEHNTPDLTQLTVTCRNNVALDETLKRIGFEGACIIAAHQYLRMQGQTSKVHHWNKLSTQEKTTIIKLGKAVIEFFLNH